MIVDVEYTYASLGPDSLPQHGEVHPTHMSPYGVPLVAFRSVSTFRHGFGLVATVQVCCALKATSMHCHDVSGLGYSIDGRSKCLYVCDNKEPKGDMWLER